MWIETRCQFHFDIAVPSPFLLMLRPRSGAQQWISRESYQLAPMVPVEEFTDLYGNLCQRLVAPVGDFRIETSATVHTTDEMDSQPGAPFIDVQQLPTDVLIYLLPSRFCETESFNALAGSITAGAQLGYDQVAAIQRWLRTNIAYLPGSSTVPVSAETVNERGYGVCRDLAHLGIALCRSLSIPARMVVGCLKGLEPMDLHAWFEAFVGGRWYTFDATQATLCSGYVAYAYGRDAADVAIYTQFGPPVLPYFQQVTVTNPDESHQS